MKYFNNLFTGTLLSTAVDSYENCFGYSISNFSTTARTIRADLDIINTGCAIFGPDIAHLALEVEYQTDTRLHVLIQDRDAQRYQVPPELFPRSVPTTPSSEEHSLLSFSFTESPFSFQVTRKPTGEVLFDTTGINLIFERQFLRLKTWLPADPNIYGLGEHLDTFRLPTDNYTRTLWTRDSDGVPYGENLYGSHPVYFEQRVSGTHGVLLLNSNGLEIKIWRDRDERQSMEFIAIGGVLDFYFFAGPSPIDVSRQYATLAGTPAMVPYWSLGFHQCKFGYQDWFQVAEVISNYSASGIPLETMWVDIDYMDRRRVFSLDPERFPLSRMRDIAHFLHSHQQHLVLMVDPAIAEWNYPAYLRGDEMNVFLKESDGRNFRSVVWPGVTVFPDWNHSNTTKYWIDSFEDAFNPISGIDIDGVWIDMNEPATMCRFPCSDPQAEAQRLGVPPNPPPIRKPPRKLPGFNVSESPRHWGKINSGRLSLILPAADAADTADCAGAQHQITAWRLERQSPVSLDNVLFPPYRIRNGNSSMSLSDMTVHTDIYNADGTRQYDTHNLYGLMMGITTRLAMLHRRPGVRPFILTRGSFAGAGKYVSKWLGDNASRWDHYRSSIAGMLAFASIFQIPVVGSDVCGFKLVPTDKLCARWATLGAFSPFYRNHAHDEAPPQEFYLWPLVTQAAKYAISVRYRLLDYLYTALHVQSQDGTPAINPLWYLYPADSQTYPIDLQYFYGNCLLVSPVTEEDATEVRIYLPDDIFYDFESGETIRGRGGFIHLKDIPFDRIPLHVRGGCVIPLRIESANTTGELRKKGFELIVAPSLKGDAVGSLILDDGVSIDGGESAIHLQFHYCGNELRIYARAKSDKMRNTKDLESQMVEVGARIDRVRVMGKQAAQKPSLVFEHRR